MKPHELTREEFHACFAEPMRKVAAGAAAEFNIWPYVDSIRMPSGGPSKALDVAYVYRDAKDRYEQVLIETDKFNVMLVVVVDLQTGSIFGHHLLDLNEEYGLS